MADMNGLHYSPDDPYYRLGPVHTCLYVRACRLVVIAGGVGVYAECQAGKYKPELGDMACTNCVIGKYSPSVAAVSVGVCTQCRSDPHSAEASDQDIDCICNAGARLSCENLCQNTCSLRVPC